MIRILTDFNLVLKYGHDRIPILTENFPFVEANKGIERELSPGQRVILYEVNDFEVEAILEYDDKEKRYYGVIDWPTRRDLVKSQ